ncbi:MAG: molybdopterin-dependent oxidoreductase [Coriobacteriia bacterium]|nr:molybdopterin-dependent oxidoreductase [Coriobacteriia bacterium]
MTDFDETEFEDDWDDELPWICEEKPWRWEEDGLTVTRGSSFTGPGCHDGCGVLMYTDKDGKLVKVEGDPLNTYNQGRLCIRCLALKDVVNHPDRLHYPLKRAGERGENKWERISWDEAIATIAEKFNAIKAEFGAEAVVFAQGTGRDIAPYLQRLAFSFGSPNYVCYGLAGNACMIPRLSVQMMSLTAITMPDYSQMLPDRYEDEDYAIPECVIIWGRNPLASNADGNFGHWCIDAMKRGSKLVVVDPRLTWLAAQADIWLQVRPGTDAALALGMLNIIIQEDLFDRDFVELWTYGFEQLAERAAEYPVEKVAEITWIPAEKILAAARMYAKAKPALIEWGVAVDMTKESVPITHAINCLVNITGNLDVPGGNVITELACNVSGYYGWGNELISREQFEKRIGMDKYPMLRYGIPLASPDEMCDAILTDKPYPIKAMWVQANNPIACMAADPKKTYDSMKKLDFVVVVDLFHTPTTIAFADIVLPAAAFPERNGVRAVFYYAQCINQAVQIGETKGDAEICRLLGKALNPEAWEPYESEMDVWDDLGAGSGLTFEEMRNYGQMIHPNIYRKYEEGRLRAYDDAPGFNTPTGRAEMYSTVMEGYGLDPLPYYEEPPESPYSTPELMEEYPLILTTGARQVAFFHSEHRQIPSLRATYPYPQIEINPEVAKEYGIEQGDWVWIENSFGRCQQKANITNVVPKWLVHADHGWWFPEEEAAEPHLFGVFKSNVNQLVPYNCGRSGFGNSYKTMICKIYKVKEGEV